MTRGSRLLLFVSSLLLIAVGPSLAHAKCSGLRAAQFPMVLNYSGAPLREIGRWFQYFDDMAKEMSVDEALRRFATSQGLKSVASDHFTTRYSTKITWAALAVRNATAMPVKIVPSTNVPWIRIVEIYAVRDGCTVEPLLRRSETTPYRSGDFAGNFLTAEPVRLAAGEDVVFVFRYGSYGFGLLPVSLESEGSLQEVVRHHDARQIAFFAFTIGFLILFLGFNFALSGVEAFLPSAMFTVAILLMAQIEGLLFRYVWPDWPGWNADASFYLLVVVVVLVFLSACYLARSEDNDLFCLIMRSAAALCAALPLLAFSIEVPTLTLMALVVCPAAIASLVVAVFIWARGVWLRQSFAVVYGGAMGAGTLIGLMAMVVGVSQVSYLGHELAQVMYLIMSLTLMTALTTRAQMIRREYELALEREVIAAKRDMEMSQALAKSEREFYKARRMAEHRRSQLAEVSHDLRQPVAALRLIAFQLGRGLKNNDQDAIVRALDYIEEVLNEYLSDSTSTDDDHIAGNDDIISGDADGHFSISVLLQTVDSLFQNVAESRNIELRVVQSSAIAAGGIVPLLRIVSNLVVNAINNGGHNKVLVGVRRRRRMTEIIVADNGPGIAQCDQQRLFEKFEKSADSSGLGLGLSIVREIASQNGFDIAMASQPGKGTMFTVTVPRLTAADCTL